MGNILTALFAFVACFFFHFRENNDKVPERSKNGPKKGHVDPSICVSAIVTEKVTSFKQVLFYTGQTNPLENVQFVCQVCIKSVPNLR